jgi:hypothetical protein
MEQLISSVRAVYVAFFLLWILTRRSFVTLL